MISILHLINLNDFKTKQKQISKIEETNFLIENPKTQNKNESKLNPKKKKIEFWDAYETTFHNLIGNMG